ncbi:hypothetical protein Q9233_010593 [Columba guinea]|nr:hypothetical protein Q9233_010593 [Columba guinea]
MASVPSAGCLLAKNQYYRTTQNSESSVSPSSSCCLDLVNMTDQDKAFHALPELVDKYWWIKSFFHCEPSPPNVGRKTLSASSVMRMENSSGEVLLPPPSSLTVVSSALEQHQCQIIVICARSLKHSYCAIDQLSYVTPNADMTNL